LDRPDYRDLPDHKELRVFRVSPERRGLLEIPALLDLLVLQAILDLRVLQEIQFFMVPLHPQLRA
jgi:hypothetical protein